MTKPALLFILMPLIFAACKNEKSPAALLRTCMVEGSADSVYCGSLAVWENRSTQTGRKINLSVTVIPALQKDSAGAPIFYLEGGPGVAASESAAFFADKENPYRNYHDIVLIDIRGSGKSNPLNCNSLQFKADLQEQLEEMYPAQAVKECYDSLSTLADLSQYTTSIIAEDMDEVRRWLGYKKINVFGLSYGTKLAQEYMRRFPEAVASVVLFSPVIMNSRIPLYHAAFAQQSLDKLFDGCAKDSACAKTFPDLKKEFSLLMEKGRKQAFVIDHTMADGTKRNLTLSWDAFQTKIRSMLYIPATQCNIPFVVHQAYLDNWKPFLSLFNENPVSDDFISEGLYLCITCAEEVPFIASNEIDSLNRHTFMSTYRIDQQQRACSLWKKGTIPADFLNPVSSSVPTLIISGGNDPVTPTSWAKTIAANLPNSKLVIIPEMAHTFDGLSNEHCFDDMVLGFISNPLNPEWNLNCIEQMKPPAYKIK